MSPKAEPRFRPTTPMTASVNKPGHHRASLRALQEGGGEKCLPDTSSNATVPTTPRVLMTQGKAATMSIPRRCTPRDGRCIKAMPASSIRTNKANHAVDPDCGKQCDERDGCDLDWQKPLHHLSQGQDDNLHGQDEVHHHRRANALGLVGRHLFRPVGMPRRPHVVNDLLDAFERQVRPNPSTREWVQWPTARRH